MSRPAASVYESILRKIVADPDTAILREGNSVIIDSSWVSLTETEADFLTELHDERS